MKYNFNVNEFNEEMYNVFSGYVDVENEEIKRLRKEIELLRMRNSHLKDEVTKLNRENKNLKENPRNKKYPLNSIRERVEREYDFLSEESRESLISAEYIFLNENEDIDFSGVYIGYIKLFEIELRGKIKLKRKFDFW